MTISVNTIASSLQSMGNAPTQAQLADLADFVSQLETVYVELRKAIEAHRVRDWDFTINTDTAETRPYTQANLAIINAKPKANAKDRTYLTAFRSFIETAHTNVIDLLDKFREGTYVPNGIDGIGHVEKLHAFTVAQGSAFQFTDVEITDTGGDAEKMLAIKTASTGTVTVPNLTTVTGAQDKILTFLGEKDTKFGDPTISITQPSGSTSATSLQSIRSGMSTSPEPEIKLDDATSLTGTESAINYIYNGGVFTGKDSLNLLPTQSLVVETWIVPTLELTSGTIDLAGTSKVEGAAAATKNIVLNARILNKDAAHYDLQDTGVIAGSDINTINDAVKYFNDMGSQVTGSGSVTTKAGAIVESSLEIAKLLSGNNVYISGRSAAYRLSDTTRTIGASVRELIDNIATAGVNDRGTVTAPALISNNAFINVSLFELDKFVLTDSKDIFTDSENQRYGVDEYSQNISGNTILSVVQQLGTTGKVEMIGSQGNQRITDTADNLKTLFQLTKFVPNTVRVKATGIVAVASSAIQAVLDKMVVQVISGTTLATYDLQSIFVDGPLDELEALATNPKLVNRLEKRYNDPTSGELSGAAIITMLAVLGAGYNGTFKADSVDRINTTDLSQVTSLTGNTRFLNSKSRKYVDSTTSSIPTNLYSIGASASATSVSSLQAVVNELGSSGSLETTNVAVAGPHDQVEALMTNSKYLNSGTSEYMVTDTMTTSQMTTFFGRLSTGKIHTANEIVGTISSIKSMLSSNSKHGNKLFARYKDVSSGTINVNDLNIVLDSLTDNGLGSVSIPNATKLEGTIGALLLAVADNLFVEKNKSTLPFRATDDVNLANMDTIIDAGHGFEGTNGKMKDSLSNIVLMKGRTLFTGKASANFEADDTGEITLSNLLSAINAIGLGMTTYSTPGITKVTGTLSNLKDASTNGQWITASSSNYGVTESSLNETTLSLLFGNTSGTVTTPETAKISATTMTALKAIALNPQFGTRASVSYEQVASSDLVASDVLAIAAVTSGEISAPNASKMVATNTSQFEEAKAKLTLVGGQLMDQA